MKKTIMMAFALLLTVSLVTGCGCSKKEDKKKEESTVKENTNKEVIKNQEVDGIKMTNTSLVTVDGISTLETTVTNDGDEDYMLVEYKIIIKGNDDKVMVEIPGFVGDTIKAGESRVITSSVDMDLSKAKSIEYEVVK
jgi:uncharacterized protein YcfL